MDYVHCPIMYEEVLEAIFNDAGSTYLFKYLFQQLSESRWKLAPFFVIGRNQMMGTLGKGDKMPSKTNNPFNSTMMALFLPASKIKNETKWEQYVFHCSDSVSQIHINSKKKHEKNIKKTVSDVPICSLQSWINIQTLTNLYSVRRWRMV